MVNPTSIISFRISAQIHLPYTAANFWDTVREYGIEVDRLIGYDHKMLGVLVDWLASESRIASLRTTDIAFHAGTQSLGIFDQHDLNVSQTRLTKKP